MKWITGALDTVIMLGAIQGFIAGALLYWGKRNRKPTGTRFDKGNKVIQVGLRDGRLYLEDGMEFKMYALTNRKFYVFDLPAEASVAFKADAAGKITGLEVQQAGDAFQWVKID